MRKIIPFLDLTSNKNHFFHAHSTAHPPYTWWSALSRVPSKTHIYTTHIHSVPTRSSCGTWHEIWILLFLETSQYIVHNYLLLERRTDGQTERQFFEDSILLFVSHLCTVWCMAHEHACLLLVSMFVSHECMAHGFVYPLATSMMHGWWPCKCVCQLPV